MPVSVALHDAQRLKALRAALNSERSLVAAVVEEREENMVLIMNAFSRVGKLAQVRSARRPPVPPPLRACAPAALAASTGFVLCGRCLCDRTVGQSVFTLPVFNMAAEPPMIFGLPDPEPFSAAEPVNVGAGCKGLCGHMPARFCLQWCSLAFPRPCGGGGGGCAGWQDWARFAARPACPPSPLPMRLCSPPRLCDVCVGWLLSCASSLGRVRSASCRVCMGTACFRLPGGCSSCLLPSIKRCPRRRRRMAAWSPLLRLWVCRAHAACPLLTLWPVAA